MCRLDIHRLLQLRIVFPHRKCQISFIGDDQIELRDNVGDVPPFAVPSGM